MTFVFFCRFIIVLSGSISVVIVAPFKASAPQGIFGFGQYARLHSESSYQKSKAWSSESSCTTAIIVAALELVMRGGLRGL